MNTDIDPILRSGPESLAAEPLPHPSSDDGETPNDDLRRRTYTVTEMAKILGIGRNTAYEACRKGEITTIKIGGRILIPRDAIDDLLNGAA